VDVEAQQGDGEVRSMTDPLAALVRVRQRTEEALRRHGLDPLRITVTPAATEGGLHELQIVAALIPEWSGGAADEAFNEVIAGADEAESAELSARLEDVRRELTEDLRQRLDGDEGFL
jgi:hypothetical protein